jgi:hypothetical protein
MGRTTHRLTVQSWRYAPGRWLRRRRFMRDAKVLFLHDARRQSDPKGCDWNLNPHGWIAKYGGAQRGLNWLMVRHMPPELGAFRDQLRSMGMNSNWLTFVESVIRARPQKNR